MAIEVRANDRRYLYRSRRVDGRVIREYEGSGQQALFAAEICRWKREEQAAVGALQRKKFETIHGISELVEESSQAFEAMLSASLLAAGYHYHRGEWRKKRSGHGSHT